MKKQKDRATANQFYQALIEQIDHARGMNIPVNAISSAASFSLLVLNRLFGENRKMSLSLQETFNKLRVDAIAERRSEQAREQQRIREEKEARERRIIVPGRDRPGSN